MDIEYSYDNKFLILNEKVAIGILKAFDTIDHNIGTVISKI